MTYSASNVLVDNWTNRRTLSLDVVWVIGFSLLTALLAQVRIPLPFTPVPLTGQTFGVLLAGAVLGSRRGFICQTLYLAAGAGGLPVFAGGAFSLAYMLGPTGGYLWSFPLAAGLLGWLIEAGAGRRIWKLGAVLGFTTGVILVSGALWLAVSRGLGVHQAALLGVYPFLPGEALKVALVMSSLPAILRRYPACESA
ncbi:MAG TPA: biotin transporter BioY [Terriglobia bacterium]|nr:biotin transporter BioY [Terriglobia bacterium]